MEDDNEDMTNVEIVSTQNWKVIPRIARTIPFGYEAHPTDPKLVGTSSLNGARLFNLLNYL